MLSDLGQFFTKVLDPILEGIRASDIGAGLAFLILIGGICVLAFAIYRYVVERQLIARANKVFSEIETERDFAEKYNVLGQDMADLPILGDAWSEFSETLIPPKRRDDGSIIPAANTLRPHSFFNTVDLPIGPKFLTVWPNIFVGIGLTITFLGLISALTEASASMADVAGDSLRVQSVVQNLLNVASAKFYASLVALFVSVILTLSLRWISTDINKLLQLLNHQIEKGVRYQSEEVLALRANDLMEEQLVQLKTFNTDLAIKIGENITEAIQPVLSEITTNNERITEQQVGALKTMGEEVSRSISGASQDAMERVAESLVDVSSKLDDLGTILANSLSGFDEQLKQSMEGLSKALESAVGDVSQNLTNSLSDMGPKIQESLSAVTETMAGLDSKVAQYAENGASAIEGATRAASQVMSAAGEDFSSSFTSATSGLTGNLENLSQHISELDRNLAQLPDRLQTVNTSLTTTSESINTSSTQFTTAASGLRAVIEPLAEFARENRAALEVLNEGLSTSSAAVQTTTEMIRTSVDSLNETVSTRLSQMEGGDEALARYVAQINESTERLLSQITVFVREIDSNFAGSIGQLKGAIEELGDVADSLTSRETTS